MSISGTRICTQKLGAPALVIIAVGLVVGFLAPGGCPGAAGGGSMSAAAGAEFKNPVLAVGESQIYQAEAESVIRNMRTQAMSEATQRQGAPELTPYEFLSIYMQAMSSLSRQAAVLEIGRQQKIEVDEDKMSEVITQMNMDQMNQQREQFTFMQGIQIAPLQSQIEKLKKDKAPAEQIAAAEKQLADTQTMTFDKAFEDQQKMTPQQYVEQQSAQIIDMAAKDPVIARSIVATAIQKELNDKYGKSVDTSDTALKASFDKIVYKQIMLTGANANTKAEEVLSKIEGGLDFDQAAKQFSMLKKPDGSVQLDTTIETRIDMIGDDMKSPVLDLKVNDVSKVVEAAGAAYIYKLVAIRPDVPEGFESGKPERIEMLRNKQITAKLNAEIIGLVGESGEKVKWIDAGLQLLTDYMNSAGEADQVAVLEGVLAKAEEVDQTFFSEIAPLVKFAVINQLQVEVKDAAKKKDLDAKLLLAFADVISVAPSIDLRFQYITALIPAGEGDKGLELLLDNAVAASTLADGGEAIMKRVELLLPKVSNQATKGNETIGKIQEEIKVWREDLAERKRLAEEETKRLADEEAALKKEEADKKKAGDQPKPTPPLTPDPKPVEPEPIEPKKPGSGG
ncbi:MAG: hypothetical protein ABIV13_03670 [Fimbriimonadales bacterium]